MRDTRWYHPLARSQSSALPAFTGPTEEKHTHRERVDNQTKEVLPRVHISKSMRKNSGTHLEPTGASRRMRAASVLLY